MNKIEVPMYTSKQIEIRRNFPSKEGLLGGMFGEEEWIKLSNYKALQEENKILQVELNAVNNTGVRLRDKLDIAVDFINRVEKAANQVFATEKEMKDTMFILWVYSRETLAEIMESLNE